MVYIIIYAFIGLSLTVFDFMRSERLRNLLKSHPLAPIFQIFRWPITLFVRTRNMLKRELPFSKDDSSTFRQWVNQSINIQTRANHLNVHSVFVGLMHSVSVFEIESDLGQALSNKEIMPNVAEMIYFEIACFLHATLKTWSIQEQPVSLIWINQFQRELIEVFSQVLRLPSREVATAFLSRQTRYQNKPFPQRLEMLNASIVSTIESEGLSEISAQSMLSGHGIWVSMMTMTWASTMLPATKKMLEDTTVHIARFG